MKQKKEMESASKDRRTFLKTNLLGGIFLGFGIPFSSSANYLKASHLPLKLQLDNGDIDWTKISEQFVFKKHKSYFNTGSLGPSPRAVIDSLCEAFEDLENRARGGEWLVKDVREKAAGFLNANPNEIALTRNATEGMNIAARSLPLKAGDEVLITNQEHIGGAAPWLALQKDKGVVVKLIELDLSGEQNLEIIRKNLSDKTKVLSFSHITCTTGLRLPAKEIVDMCRERGIYSCVDGAQAVGMIPVNLGEINPDFYTCGGHKWLFGPKGTGILFIKNDILSTTSPLFAGAYADEEFDLNNLKLEFKQSASREEYGTRSTPLLLGLSTAIDFHLSIGKERIEERGFELASHLRQALSQIPNVQILTPEKQQYSAAIVTFRVKDKDGFELQDALRLKYSTLVRHVYENDLNGIRLSLSVFNVKKDVDDFVTALMEVITE